MAQQLSPEQLEKLLRYAGERLNTTPEAIQAAFERDGLYGVSQQAGEPLDPALLTQAKALLADKEKTARLMNSPAVRQLLEQLSDKK